MIELAYDAKAGIVTSSASGLLNIPELRRTAAETRLFMKRARDDFGRALYLVDARRSIVQPQEIIEEVERIGSFLQGPEDRIAVVVATSLAKMQTRRLFTLFRDGEGKGEAFMEEAEARDWLIRA